VPENKPGGIDRGKRRYMSVFLLLFIFIVGIKERRFLESVELNGRSVRQIS